MIIYVQYFESQQSGLLTVIEKIATVSTVPLKKVRSDKYWMSEDGSRYRWYTRRAEFEVDEPCSNIHVRILHVRSAIVYDKLEVSNKFLYLDSGNDSIVAYYGELKSIKSHFTLYLDKLRADQVNFRLEFPPHMSTSTLGYGYDQYLALFPLQNVYPDFWTRKWYVDELTAYLEHKRELMSSIRCLPGIGIEYFQASNSWSNNVTVST